jgi:hypothetical protein
VTVPPQDIGDTDDNGEVLIEHGWPAKGTIHVSNGIRRGRPSKGPAPELLHQLPGPSPFPDQANLGVLLIGDMPEAQRDEHARGCVRAGQRVRDDMVNLATGDSEFHQRPSSGSAEPPAPELRGDFVADLDGAVDWRGGEAT